MAVKKRLISALPALTPTLITNLRTGEIATLNDHNAQVTSLVNYVTQSARDYYHAHGAILEQSIRANPPRFSPAEWARAHGYNLDTSSLSRSVKAQSRIERLYRHKLVSEVSSYVSNPNPRKQPPTFSEKINLGAVDSQMASLSFNESEGVLTLRFKAWEAEYLLDFTIPAYVLKRNIKKWSLPTIELRGGSPVYIFAIEETPELRGKGSHKAGLDLGRKEPFTMVVTNEHGKRVADYKTSARVRWLNAKRERILVEKRFIVKKANAYDSLQLDSTALRLEARRKGGKALVLGDEVARQVGADVARKLAKHELNVLAVEDLRWAVGARYGSKWAHAKTQEKIEHAVARKGITVRKVNPKNTSQECHVCGARVVHNSTTRVARCVKCKRKFDRDFNAAMNIVARLRNGGPNRQRRLGDDCSSHEQVIEDSSSPQLSRNSVLPLVRLVT